MSTNKTSRVKVVTFGCRLNTYESEVIHSHAQRANLDNVIIVNTCAVTKEAERQAKQSIRRLKRENKGAKIIATGCAAQIHQKQFCQMPEVDFVIGNEEKMRAETYRGLFSNPFIGQHEKVKVNDIMDVKEMAGHLVKGFHEHTRAFVQVQNGCNHRCTFCIIPFGRGNSRSVPVGQVVEQVRLLVQEGYKEIVFTGVDISSYGADLPGTPTLGQMVRRTLANVPDLQRLRISSIDCIEIDEDLFDVIAEDKRLMPHMHLSLQSGDTLILKRMARRHRREDIIALCDRLRQYRPDLTLGADIITGFPTETEEMFQNTVNIVEQCNITWLHVFPYSEREGTPAARILKKVPVPIRKERAKRLRVLNDQMKQKFFDSQIGKVYTVLVEKNSTGHAENFAPVKIMKNTVEGAIVKARIVGFTERELLAVAV